MSPMKARLTKGHVSRLVDAREKGSGYFVSGSVFTVALEPCVTHHNETLKQNSQTLFGEGSE
jgi:hypothetical protein